MEGTTFSKNTIVSLISSFLLLSCFGNKSYVDNRCPELVEKAEYFNAKVVNGEKEGPMGIQARVEYVDSVYRIIQVVDEDIIPAEKLKLFYGNQKPNMIASLSSSTEQERKEYQLMVDYRVSFEHLVKSKKTGEVIVRTILTPDEIKEALSHELSYLDKLKMHVETIKKTIPREMEAGYTMNDISCTDDVVSIEIIIDEDIKDFNEATKIRNWSRAEQAVTLGDLTVGLTFWSVAAQVPIGFDFHFIGSNGKNELHIGFLKDEVVEYNEVMNRIKDQQFK